MKHLLRIIISIAIINGQWSMVNSQSISRKVISAAGGTMTAGGYMLTYNVGETAVHTLTAGSSMLTQGFQQPGEQIITGAVTPLSYCAGNAVSVPFSAIDIGGGNTFTAQLSNASGSFASPVNIGTLAGNASGTINATIPSNTPSGSAYRIRIVSNSPGKTGSDNGVNIAISNAPPGIVTGGFTAPAFACNTNVSLISVTPVGGSNIHYSWNTGTNTSVVLFSTNIGGPFTAGPFSTPTNQVYAQFGSIGPGQSGYYVCVQGVNPCGSTANRCIWIKGTVNTPGPVTPVNGVVACPNTTQTYSCGLSGATVYTWTLNGATAPITPNGGNNPTNVTVAFPSNFTSGQLCVTAALSCGGASTSAPRCITISKNPANPNVPAGTATACPGATGVSYSIPAVNGASGYSWTVPANATIATGANTPSITVNFPTPFTGSHSVCVTTTSACGASAAKCKTVASGVPNTPAGITGPLTNVCGSVVQYSVVSPQGGLTYTWTNPAGTTLSGQGNATIQLTVSPTFTNGVLTVKAGTALCFPATSAARSSSTIWGRPNNAGAITQNPAGPFCSGAGLNFTVVIPPVGPVPVYTWTSSNGAITAGQGSNIIDVTWGTNAPGTITVRASNGCGLSAGTNSQVYTPANCREKGIYASSAMTLSIYPNPAHDHLTVSIYVNEQTGFNLKLRDMSGRIILSEDRQAEEGLNSYNMDLKGFAKGIYMLEVKSVNEHWKTKVVIE